MLSRRAFLLFSAGTGVLGGVAGGSVVVIATNRSWRARLKMLIRMGAIWNPSDPHVKVGVTMPVENWRALIIQRIFTGAGLPDTGFTSTTTDQTDPLIAYSLHPANLSRYDTVTVDFKNAGGSTVGTIAGGIWRPTSPNNKLVIQMLGHASLSNSLDPNQDDHTHGQLVKLLVEAGYTVCVLEMPFHGNLSSHNLLPAPSGSLNPLRYFVEAPIKAINALLPEGFNPNVLYCGHSGGGWVGPLLMALDTRIRAGASNAGFLALYMDESSRDYEQFLPGLDCDYLDLIILATSGGTNGARTFIESHGDFDPCCFHKANYDTGAPYFDYLAGAVSAKGGIYQGVFDANSFHNYSSSRRVAIKNLFDSF